jgi:ABC-type transport system involved in multi-copper enzyme maturation permease subunit
VLNGAFALLERSLRIDARAWSTHLVRLGLIGTVYFSLCYVLATQDMVGAPGLRFFEKMAYLEIVFMTLLGIGFFSTVITEEKEEDTLGLMLMAGISPLGILAGKSGGPLLQTVLLIAVQQPFMLLAVTMGGVTSEQVWAATIAFLAYMVLLSGFGLLCSTIATRSRTASGLMVVGLAVYFALPSSARYFLWLRINSLRLTNQVNLDFWATICTSISDACILPRMSDILSSGYSQSPWSIQVTSNVIVGLICALVAWSVFGLATRNPATEAGSRGLVARKREFLRLTAGRAWNNPFLWKDFHFVAGGIGGCIPRTLYYLGLWFVIFELEQLTGAGVGPGGNSVEIYLILTSLSVAIDAGIVLARSIHDEVRSQTLTTLLMLPQSSVKMIYAKFAGALLGWLPGPIIELVVTILTEAGRRDFKSLVKNEHGGWALVFLFALIPHFSSVAAAYARWGAVPIGIGMGFGVYFAIIGTMWISMSGGISQDLFLNLWSCVMFCLCLASHIVVLLRMQALAAK